LLHERSTNPLTRGIETGFHCPDGDMEFLCNFMILQTLNTNKLENLPTSLRNRTDGSLYICHTIIRDKTIERTDERIIRDGLSEDSTRLIYDPVVCTTCLVETAHIVPPGFPLHINSLMSRNRIEPRTEFSIGIKCVALQVHLQKCLLKGIFRLMGIAQIMLKISK